MKEILTFINEYLGLILAIITSLIAITEKIKKPIRNSLKKIIMECNKPLEEKIDENIEKVKNIEYTSYKNKADMLRKDILDFAGDIRMGCAKTAKQWENFIISNQDYENIIEQLGLENGYTHEEYEFCMKVYKKLNSNIKKLTK